MSPPKEKLKQYIVGYLEENRVLTLATSKDNVPWASSVMFAYDDNLNFYFISDPNTRKTQNLLSNPQISATINEIRKIKGKTIGIQLEGTAQRLDKEKDTKELDIFKKRFDWTDDYLHDHDLYKIVPEKVYYLDDEKFGPGSREELEL